MLQRDAVVAGQPQVEARAGNQQRHTQRRVTPAHQRRPTTPHKDNQLNTPTRATTGNTPTRPLHVQQTRTPRMQHSTGGATNGQARWRQWKSNKNGPERGQSRNRPRVRTDRKLRRRGNPPAPASKSRNHGTGAQGRMGALWSPGGERWLKAHKSAVPLKFHGLADHVGERSWMMLCVSG